MWANTRKVKIQIQSETVNGDMLFGFLSISRQQGPLKHSLYVLQHSDQPQRTWGWRPEFHKQVDRLEHQKFQRGEWYNSPKAILFISNGIRRNGQRSWTQIREVVLSAFLTCSLPGHLGASRPTSPAGLLSLPPKLPIPPFPTSTPRPGTTRPPPPPPPTRQAFASPYSPTPVWAPLRAPPQCTHFPALPRRIPPTQPLHMTAHTPSLCP